MSSEKIKSQLIALQSSLRAFHDGDGERTKPVMLDQSSVGRLSRMDAIQGQAMSSAVRQRRENTLKKIDQALQRIDDGDYGYCITCGEEIASQRLEIDPTASQCTSCASGGFQG
ncbi:MULTISPECIES: TraR/DksA C4-type zinc finger protein [Iodidimonas]|jgi:DnaK suppressor protein|uniref:Molecular chaperone DnaK n=1 Tax=Iodidimonas nitroreducens TaxID=1236968 RepID=A0A5A7N5S0_9PROT|nr:MULTISPECIES: TraR/DksA C4-type zinc finger protein [Iodidimonas]GAK32845.1 RNA polymerase-binding transcription factor DksA [alpha proteobacterium Q-1]GER02995.1 molecular chaperone DnaK [Iodidimonas nitroreducens]